MAYSRILTVFLLCSVFCSISADERVIFVSPSGNDYSNCSEVAKCTLDRALRLASGLNSTTIFASKGNYSLKTSHNFTRFFSFGLFGNGSRDDVQITCEPNVSLSFTLSENITFERVKFQKCGGWHQSSVRAKKNYPDLKGARFKTALGFRYCRNLRMSNVEISSSPGLGANLYDVGGVVSFTDCLFADNYASYESINVRWEYQTERNGESGRYIYSGGGVYIILNQYGYDTLNVTRSEHDSYQHNNSYEFTNCTFIRNKALWLNATKENELNTPERPFSRGGGLAVFFRGNASGCVVKIQSCNFTDNEASWGGGLQVEMKDKTENNSLIVEASNFLNNSASLYGGGARLGNVPLKAVQLRINQFILTNCSFVKNKAIWGGGTSLYGTTIPRKCVKHTNPSVIQFFFYGCSWLENEGNFGAAMGAYLKNQNEDQIGPEIPYRVLFQNDTTFHSNKVVLLQDYLTTGQGSLCSVQVPLIFRSHVQFLNNTQSALVLDGSVVNVHDRLDFIKNTGFKGGAIAMYGRSRIILSAYTSSLTFEANKCDDGKGGALYIQAPGSPLVSFNATKNDNQACFFGYSDPSKDYDEWNTSVIFEDNNAILGKSVYATTLKNCRRVGESRQHNSVLKWNFVKFVNSSQNVHVNTDPVELQYNEKDWKVAPGEVFNAVIKLLDEVENPTRGIVKVSVEASSVHLDNLSPLFLATDEQITNIRLRGKNGSVFSVKLRYIGSGQLLEKTIQNVTLNNCYAGFSFNNVTLRCECMSSDDEMGRGVSYCGDDGKTLFVKEGYWAGNVDRTFATYFCPTGYCNSSSVVNNSYQYFAGHVCIESRNQKSILCGECKDNYSISIGSEYCVKNCANWHLVFLLPFGLGFLVIVIIVMLIDLDFFTGYLNAWLYSYQIMKLLTPDGFEFDPVMEFIIAFTNVRINIGNKSFCLAKGLDDADKLVLEYTIPVYVLLVVGLLTWLIRRYPNWCFSRKVLRSTPSAPFRAVCTILVFCYTDITGISLKILKFATVGQKTVLYDQGGLEFFRGKHLAYGIVAIIFIVVFVVPFPLILLFRARLTRGLRPVLNLVRWGPFFDAFQSCFKDEYRWCAAFYFICRLGILVISTYMPHISIKGVVLETACILILVVFASLRPYKEARDVDEDESSYEWIYISDVALLITLSFIAAISSTIEWAATSEKKYAEGLKVVVKILAYVPLVVLLVLGYRVLRNYCPVIDIRNCEHQEDETTPIMSETTDAHSSQKGTPEVSITQYGSIGSPGGAPQPTVAQHSSRGSHDS